MKNYGLIIETSSENCSVAFSEDGQMVSWKEENKKFSHSALLHSLIQEVMDTSGMGIHQLSYVVVGSGPGSYLGLRIGYASAKGLAFALNIPLIGISSAENIFLQARAIHEDPEALYYVMIDAGRKEVYQGVWNGKGEEILPVQPVILNEEYLSSIGEQKKVILAGSGAEKTIPFFSKKKNVIIFSTLQPSAGPLAPRGFEKFRNKDFMDVEQCEPDYLKQYFFRKQNSPL